MLTKEAWNILISEINTKVAEKKHTELFDFFQQNVRIRLDHSDYNSAHFLQPVLEVRNFYGGWEPVWEPAQGAELRKPKLTE